MEPIVYTTPTEIDERWMADYVNFGLCELQQFVDNYQAFHLYCERMEAL